MFITEMHHTVQMSYMHLFHLSAEVRFLDCCCWNEDQLPQDSRAHWGTRGSELTCDNKLLIKVCTKNLPADQQLQGRWCHFYNATSAHQVPRCTPEDYVSRRWLLQKGQLCLLCLCKDDHFIILPQPLPSQAMHGDCFPISTHVCVNMKQSASVILQWAFVTETAVFICHGTISFFGSTLSVVV